MGGSDGDGEADATASGAESDRGRDPDSDRDRDRSPDRDRGSDLGGDRDWNRDAEALLGTLVEEGIVRVGERPDGSEAVTTTAEFEDAYEVYLDTYRSIPEDEFVASVGEVFGLDSAEATAQRIEELDVTREQLAAYLALDATLEGSWTTAELSRMAVVTSALEPATPVPEALEHLDDESYGSFVAEHDRAMITVWKRRCDPCEAMKAELDGILATVPDSVAVGGIDGEEEVEFRREYGIESAPALLLFENGEFEDGFTGRATAERVEAACAEVYEA